MQRFNQGKPAEEQLADVKADRWDSILSPSHPAFQIAERAFRRGFAHALNEIVSYAEMRWTGAGDQGRFSTCNDNAKITDCMNCSGLI